MRTQSTRFLMVLLTGALLTLLLSGCTWGRRQVNTSPSSSISPRKQPNSAALSVDVQALRMENEALRASQRGNEKKLEEMTTLVHQMRREQRAFREAMATNFDLLEQSVALTLSNTVIADLGGEYSAANNRSADNRAAETAVVTPNTPSSTISLSVQGGSGNSVASAPVRNAAMNSIPTATGNTTARKIAARKTTARTASPSSAKIIPAVVVTPLPAPTLRKGHQSDPDLQPPTNPRKLTAHRPAKKLYEKGFALFAKRQFDQSIIVFSNFLNRFPTDIYSDNAQFWIGESYLRLNKPIEAEEAYRKVLRNFEHRSTLEGYKTPDAIYRIGQTYKKRNQSQQARLYFQTLAKRFPESSAGRKAKRDLASLGMKTAAN